MLNNEQLLLKVVCEYLHVNTYGCSGNDRDVVIPSLPSSGRQPTDSPRFLMDGLGTKQSSLVPTVWNYCRIRSNLLPHQFLLIS